MPANEKDFSKSSVDLRMWRRLIAGAGIYRRNLAFVGIFMFCSATIDVVSPLIMAWLIDHNITKNTWAGATPWVVLYLVLVLFQAANVFGFVYNAARAENGITCEIRLKAFERLQELSFSYYDTTPVGYIMSRLTSDAARIADTIAWSLVDLLWSLAYMAIAATTMLIYNWKLGLMVLATTPLIALISTILRKYILRAYREVRKANSRITGAFNEGITGAKTTKTLVLEDLNFRQFRSLTTDMYDQSVRSAVLSSLLMPLVMSIGSVGVALILWQGGVETINGVITLGTLSFFLTLGSMFFDPINNVARIFAELQSSQAAVERVITLVDTQPEITDTEKVAKKFGGVFDTPKETWPKIIGKVDFDHVTFRYGDGTAVLRDFSLHVRAGETIALVGETGSGKSTIVNLLCRFYEPTQGRILIDGVDYRERSQLWLHSNLGYVLQSPHLFSGTIRDNIRYGKLTATDAEIENVARLIGAHAFIGRLEHGYDTQVGEGGGLLSTGEKQLISFARAILANPALFILDEATSSIDTEAEQAIQFAIDRVRGGRTSFIIAHRLSTIRNADRILVIDRGRILEEGTHAQLMRRRGHYYELYTTQFRQEAEDAALGCPPVPENV